MNRNSAILVFLCTALIVQLMACSTGLKHEQPGQKLIHLSPGKVISELNCLSDSTLSYALYLPTKYDPSRRYPLIIAFDSHAAGKLPVDLLSSEAERFGYIVAGSNNSKNGQAWEITSAQYQVLRGDILQRLSIDTNRIYTAGFSGGSRVASSVAIYLGGISGVIGCSAGFPQINKPPATRFSYLGIVGNEDFNYTEMKALDKGLEDAGFVHHLLVFNGTHSWPPADVVPSVFTWLELDAVRRKLKLPDQTFIYAYAVKCLQEADSLNRLNEAVAEYKQCLKTINFLKDVADISAFANRATRLSQTEQVKKQAAEDDRITQKETQLQQYYAGSIGPQSEEWWRVEVKRLNGINANIAKADRTMYKRVLSYLSLVAYMKSSGALRASEKERAGYFIRVYALVDPSNPEAPYLLADWYASQGKDEESLKSLSKAIILGFNDIRRLETDSALANLKGKPVFESLSRGIKDNKGK